MPHPSLEGWQSQFFAERVASPASGAEGVYFREQVFGALDVLSTALPDLEEALGEPNFRYFVRELLSTTQPTDAMGTSLIPAFLDLLHRRPELSNLERLQVLIAKARENLAPG